MNYEEVLSKIHQYDSLYISGMKKHANVLIGSICDRIEALSQTEFDDIIRHLVFDLCETNILDFLSNRGNGLIPFRLKNTILKWLYPRCQEHHMPEMRWFYQLLKNDADYSEAAYHFLQEAYECTNSDKITKELVFHNNVDGLEFGLHELPNGILISDDEFIRITQQCDQIISDGIIPQNIINRYIELKNSYLSFISSHN